ncbi:Hpt domain-containing protein [Arthrobacter sp. H20]|uniref:Hpt domain-containing protein n=1 Tax=Arthrobacter sp. H20 TaxID=1267981 RepID=UPI000686D2AC|nr:Hpt domain-containing protein [Arthrobacter sp. H20]
MEVFSGNDHWEQHREPSGAGGKRGYGVRRTISAVRPVIRQPLDNMPLVDQEALRALSDQLENPSALTSFVLDFVQAWEEKYLRFADAVERRDHAAALDAVLSIKTTSAMVGAARLAGLAARIEELVRVNNMGEASGALPFVHDYGLQTLRELVHCSEAPRD